VRARDCSVETGHFRVSRNPVDAFRTLSPNRQSEFLEYWSSPVCACSLVSSLLLSGATMSQQSSLTQSAHSVRQVLTAYSHEHCARHSRRTRFHLIGYLPGTAAPWVAENLKNALIINIVLAVFNLFPLPPLDGGRIAVGVLPNAIASPLARLEPYGMPDFVRVPRRHPEEFLKFDCCDISNTEPICRSEV
jgi:hypothetical protein